MASTQSHALPSGEDDGICEECSCIDLSAIRSSASEGGRVDYRLKNSYDMHKSAAAGCKGCRFFFDVLTRSCDHNQDIMKAFVQRKRDILISAHGYDPNYPKYCLTTNLKFASMHNANLLRLDLCLAAAEHDYKYRPRFYEEKRPVPADPKSDDCMNMAASWIEECVENHEGCGGGACARLPTRLLEVMPSPAGSTDLRARLHISDGVETGRFATLSHCWGGKIDFVLKHGNLEQLKSCIPVEQLPRSFQDALWVTRRLGLRYLWIDALCIVQDSNEDWAREAAQMAHIYSAGYVMLSAVAAPDGRHGLLRQRSILRSHCFGPRTKITKWRWKHLQWWLEGNEDSDASNEHASYPGDTDSWDGTLFSDDDERAVNALCFQTQSEWTSRGVVAPRRPLDTRAWCYQELLMASRVIHFGAQKLTWECATATWAEDYGLYALPTDDLSEASPLKSSVGPLVRKRHGMVGKAEPDVVEEAVMHARLDKFYFCVSNYVCRDLTFRDDMLPAFSGLASVFQHPQLGQYIAGLWEADLIFGLGWLGSGRGSQPKTNNLSAEYVGPSWSWAGLRANGADGASIGFNGERDTYWPGSKDGWCHMWEVQFKPRVVSHNVELATSDLYGKVKSAEIVLRAFCRPVLAYFGKLDNMSKPFNYSPLQFDAFQGEVGSCPWKFSKPHHFIHQRCGWPKDLSEDPPPRGEGCGKHIKEYTALQIGRKLYPFPGGPPMLVMLILEEVAGREGTFRRVGTLTLKMDEKQMVPEKWEER